MPVRLAHDSPASRRPSVSHGSLGAILHLSMVACMKEKALFVRLPEAKHRALSGLAAAWGVSLSTVIDSLVDQVLFQCVPMYDAPQWLLDAVESGLLPIEPCPIDGAIDAVDNVVSLGRAR